MLSTGNFSELNVAGDAYIGGDLLVEQDLSFQYLSAQNLYAETSTAGFSSATNFVASEGVFAPGFNSVFDSYNYDSYTSFQGVVDFSSAEVTGLESMAGATGPAGAPGPAGFGIYATARTDAAGYSAYSVGIATVAVESIGTYRYILSQPLPGAQYSVMGQPLETTTDTNVMISEINDTGFLLKVGKGDNGKTDDTLINCPHCVTVFAG